MLRIYFVAEPPASPDAVDKFDMWETDGTAFRCIGLYFLISYPALVTGPKIAFNIKIATEPNARTAISTAIVLPFGRLRLRISAGIKDRMTIAIPIATEIKVEPLGHDRAATERESYRGGLIGYGNNLPAVRCFRYDHHVCSRSPVAVTAVLRELHYVIAPLVWPLLRKR